MSGPYAAISPARINGLLLLLCAIALGSPLVPIVPGDSTSMFWLCRAIGLTIAIAAVFLPRFQRWAMFGVLLFLVYVPCAQQMRYRSWTGPGSWCHDSVVQFEEAIRMVRQKRNPYKEDFSQTALNGWNGFTNNPAIHHFVYPPMLLYISVPVEAVCRALLWKMPENVPRLGDRFYDQRIVVLGFFFAYFGVVWHYLRDHPHRVGITSMAVLNPFLAPFVIEGRNDVAMLFWLAAAWVAYQTDQRRYGHLLLGLAIATKTLLLPMIPFVAFANRKDLKVCLPLLIAPLLLTSLPFLAADPISFIDDLFLAVSGLGAHPFAMRGWGGFGFANVVLHFGWVKSPESYFPFGLFQAPAYLACLYFGLKGLAKKGTDEGVFLWGAAGIFVALFFGRFIHDNYIGLLLAIAAISQTARETPPASSSTSSAG